MFSSGSSVIPFLLFFIFCCYFHGPLPLFSSLPFRLRQFLKRLLMITVLSLCFILCSAPPLSILSLPRAQANTKTTKCAIAWQGLRASRARQRPATPLATGEKDFGPRRAAGQRSGSPGENRENGLRIGHAARASLDVAARRKSAGRVVARQQTGARRAKRAMWHRARQV